MYPKVSVIVPVFNVQKYIGECVDSILNQTYPNLEIVLIDDGSTDDSGRICDEYSCRFENVNVIHKSNAGLGYARNTGLENATGDFVTFIDGDDYVSSKHISNLMDMVIKDNSDICLGGFKRIQDGNVLEVKENSLFGRSLNSNEIKHELIPRMCGKLDYHTNDDVQMSVCMNVYNLQIIKSYDICFVSERDLISEDFVFNIDYLVYAKSASVSDSCEYYYRYNGESLSHRYNNERLNKEIAFTDYIIERMKIIGVFEEAEQRIYSTFLAWVRIIAQSEQANYETIGFKKSLKRIKELCNNDYVIKKICIYDDSKLLFQAKLMNRLLRYKFCLLVWVMSYIKALPQFLRK